MTARGDPDRQRRRRHHRHHGDASLLGSRADKVLGSGWQQYLKPDVQRQELGDAFRISVPIAVPGMARNWAIIVTRPIKGGAGGADELARQLTDMNRAAMTQQLIGALIVLVLALGTMLVLPAASRAPSARWSAWWMTSPTATTGSHQASGEPASGRAGGLARASIASSTSCRPCSGRAEDRDGSIATPGIPIASPARPTTTCSIIQAEMEQMLTAVQEMSGVSQEVATHANNTADSAKQAQSAADEGRCASSR